MPTFYDPVVDASEAADALRGLAHASRSFEHPEDAYGVIGDLLSGVRSLQQSLQQLAARHARHEGRAFDDAGNQATGIGDARLASKHLTDAATALDQVEDHLNSASQTAGRIAWHPVEITPSVAEPTIGDAVTVGGAAEPVNRWVNVAFLQGDQADAVLWLIDRDGPDAAIEHLSGYDYGSETTDAAMENGYVYDTPPTGALDRETVSGEYTMIANPDLGHVALYRRHQIDPADRLDAESPTGLSRGGGASAGAAMGAGAAAGAVAAGALGARAGRGVKAAANTGAEKKSWFSHAGIEAVKRDRGISL